jgi:hypothetical protein
LHQRRQGASIPAYRYAADAGSEWQRVSIIRGKAWAIRRRKRKGQWVLRRGFGAYYRSRETFTYDIRRARRFGTKADAVKASLLVNEHFPFVIWEPRQIDGN